MEEAHPPSLRRHAAGGKGAEIACGQVVPSTGNRCLSDEGRSGQLAAGVLAAVEELDDEFDVVEVELSFADELEDSFEEESEFGELTVLDLLERESVA
ncbi:hypothetical protein [Brevibacterium linens]|uniref:hypothetical protein n=1 Tax=Brevibacterium linens TaxID=1703 RepID=UPI003F8C2375